MAVVPTPNATHPTAPLCGVWLSLPMTTCPGSTCRSSILEWQMASEPCTMLFRAVRGSSPYSVIPCSSANSSCFFFSSSATSSSPSAFRASVMASSRKVR